jgi:uncharacterized protein (DUF1697 family)
MATVVLLRGVNVGGHRVFRPTTLARQLEHLDIVNIGAAGTFVIRRPIAPAQLRAQIAKLLPFAAEIVICAGGDFLRLASSSTFTRRAPRADVVRFLSVMTRAPRSPPRLPLQLPATGAWLVRLLDRQGRFVFGQYRRHMKTIGYLNDIDRLVGAPVTTRNWNTVGAIIKALSQRTSAP